MNRHLEHYKLGTLCSVKHGYPFDGSKFADHGTYIVLTPGNFFEKGGFKRIKGKEKYYTGAFPQEYLCSKDDLIVAMTQQAEGLLGSTALVPEDNLYLHNQRIGLVFHNHDLVDKLYLYYLFMTKSVRKQISDSASGTKIKHTSPDKIYSVSVSIPSIDIQRKNALLLYWIDKKIENNSLICSELEALAKTLYNYWFVQFDFPDENGRPYRNSGGEMVWNEQLKREIPKGWRCVALSDFISVENSSVNPATLGTEIMEHYSIPAYDDNFYPAFEQADTIQSGKYRVRKNSILVSKLNPQFKRVWDPFCISENTICSTEFMVYISHNDYLRPFCFALVNSDGFYRHMVSKAISSTGSRKRIQPDVSLMYQFAVPNTDSLLSTFSERYRPIMDKLKQVRLENQELTKLRDWLLPMLMNGQARVN